MTNDGRYEAHVQSGQMNSKAAITVNEDHLLLESSGSVLSVPYANIDLFYIQNYRLYIVTDNTGEIILSQMGREMDSLYEHMWNSYNDRTLKAFFVTGSPLLETEGEYSYSDTGASARGTAKIKLYENCLCILPPNAGARRIPLCFMREPVMEDFSILMTLDTDEEYRVMRLGSYTRRLFELLVECMRAILKNSAAAARELDSSLTPAQISDIARLTPEGAAASVHKLGSISRSYVEALEARVAESRAAAAYSYFKEICSSQELYSGMKSGLSWSEEGKGQAVWVAAVKDYGDEGAAAVELALGQEDSAATYLYRFRGNGASFFKRLNHAMEAVSFHREVVSMPDGELGRAENALYAMAVKRTGALRFLRSCFAGRAIHRTEDSWRRSVSEVLR